MSVREVIEKRRAYRSLDAAEITDALIHDLADHARLSPSCFNKQPWRFVFVHSPGKRQELFTAMSKGNEWTQAASMVIAVSSRKDLDCLVKEREYYLFDTGMATAFLLLRATELGLVAHPIAGFDEDKAKEILGIPPEMRLITLVLVGKKADRPSPLLSEKMQEAELKRPPRLDFSEFASIDTYKN